MREEIFVKEKFRLITMVMAISSLLIMIISHLHIDEYLKYAVIPSFILIISYIFLIRKFDIDTRKKAYYYLIPIVLILISNFIFKIDESNKILNILVVPILLSIFFISLTNDKYSISRRFLGWFLDLFPSGLFSNLKYLKLNKIKTNDKNKKIFSVILGIVIGFPIVIIILKLLAGADKYFEYFISDILKFISNVFSFDNIVDNILLIIISFIVLFSTFVNILKNRVSKDKKIRIRNINSTIVNTILVMVNFVFLLFLISEISKLTGNFLNIPAEYTYAKYAREGFFQLLFVTVINISMILYFVYYSNVMKENIFTKILTLILILFSILLIFNSYYRMALYISAYSFTILRMQVILFLTMELIIFILITDRICKNNNYNEAFAFMIIIVTTYILNLYICNDFVISNINKLFG